MASRNDGLLDKLFGFHLVSNAERHHGALGEPAGDGARLLILEFDDQGIPFRPDCMQTLDAELTSFAGRNPIIIAFTHGWKHDADAADSNLLAFKGLLARVAQGQATGAADGAPGRPVLGVFLSWRGLSRAGNWLWLQSSFWDRQEAAQRVALGSVREALGRLKAFRNPAPGAASSAPRATLIVIGHSFGGLIVYAAVAQSLIEAATTSGAAVPSFGDLLLLINPAFSAVSYLPIFAIIQRGQFPQDQLPVFVSVTAENDQATGMAFPAGNWFRRLSEATRGMQEASALTHTMGHLDWMRTHALSKSASSVLAPAMAIDGNATMGTQMRGLSQPSQTVDFGGVQVTSLPDRPPSPFWTASATKDVIDGHNGIFTANFESFVHALVHAHVSKGDT